MRKDPPFDTEYIYATYILERAELRRHTGGEPPAGPAGHEREGLHSLVPGVLRAHADHARHERPCTRSCASRRGSSASHCTAWAASRSSSSRPETRTPESIFETLTAYGTHYAIVQRYIPDIAQTGDARVILVDGEPVPYALARMPSASDHRGNLAAGAKGVGRPLNDRDRWLAARIGPALRELGMLFVGLDVIGGFVTEINVTSPTGVREIDRQFGTDIAGALMDAIALPAAPRRR